MTEQNLKPCPFCGKELHIMSRKFNPGARCVTENCRGSRMPVVNLDVPSDIEEWNTRAAQPQAVELLRDDSLAASFHTLGQYRAALIHALTQA